MKNDCACLAAKKKINLLTLPQQRYYYHQLNSFVDMGVTIQPFHCELFIQLLLAKSEAKDCLCQSCYRLHLSVYYFGNISMPIKRSYYRLKLQILRLLSMRNCLTCSTEFSKETTQYMFTSKLIASVKLAETARLTRFQ